MSSEIIYSGGLDESSISKMKIVVRRALRSAIFDNFREELSDQDCISLLPQFCNQDSLVVVCRKLHLVSCRIYLHQPILCSGYPGISNCYVFFDRKIKCITNVSI